MIASEFSVFGKSAQRPPEFKRLTFPFAHCMETRVWKVRNQEDDYPVGALNK